MIQIGNNPDLVFNLTTGAIQLASRINNKIVDIPGLDVFKIIEELANKL